MKGFKREIQKRMGCRIYGCYDPIMENKMEKEHEKLNENWDEIGVHRVSKYPKPWKVRYYSILRPSKNFSTNMKLTRHTSERMCP